MNRLLILISLFCASCSTEKMLRFMHPCLKHDQELAECRGICENNKGMQYLDCTTMGDCICNNGFQFNDSLGCEQNCKNNGGIKESDSCTINCICTCANGAYRPKWRFN